MAAIDIVTENQARDYLGKSRSSPEWDDFFKGSGDYPSGITIASRRCEDFIQNKIQIQELTDQLLDGSGCYEMELPWYPIIRIAGDAPGDYTKLQYRNSVADGWVNLFANQTDFNNYLYIDPVLPYKLCILENFLTFPQTGRGYRNIRVSWLAGYEIIPGDIITCCLEMIMDLSLQFNFTSGSTGAVLNTSGGRLGMQNQSYQGMNNTYLEMKPRWEKMLSPYRKLAP